VKAPLQRTLFAQTAEMPSAKADPTLSKNDRFQVLSIDVRLLRRRAAGFSGSASARTNLAGADCGKDSAIRGKLKGLST